MRTAELSMVSPGLSSAAIRFVQDLRLKLAKRGTMQVLGGSCAWRSLFSACTPGKKIYHKTTLGYHSIMRYFLISPLSSII